ncbi:MAG: sulfate adenylyltransferase [Alteromonadaceae bacterium TMED7]|jgi:predicted transglutaminase-like cysteine proteinase|nr:MAG: sulfate adenylyltransferase [Alteromonadaceae bacterium TMED7]|tara:strand:- start:13083 stop:13631 length:549 start_codon:yes stop_codon:yes gene_type:complete
MRSISSYGQVIAVTLGLLWSGANYAGENYWPRVKAVNAYFNSNYAVSDDLSLWAQEDHWATPQEFAAKGAGDCEDFAIAKYFELVAENVPKELLALSYVTLNGNQAHMVLLYHDQTEDTWYVLDSYNPAVLPVSKRPDLDFIYSFNELGVWVPEEEVIGKKVAEAGSLSKWQEILKSVATDN